MSKDRFTRPVGSHFKCCGVELVVVENTHGPDGYCGGEEDPCYFEGGECTKCSDILGHCSNYIRDDCKDVYFKEVKS